jgi:hypothetical protein
MYRQPLVITNVVIVWVWYVGYSTLKEQVEQSDWQDGVGHCCELVLTKLLNSVT